MAHQKTSKPVGTLASKALRSKATSKNTKSIAGSALSNRPHPKQTQQPKKGKKGR